MKKWNGNPVKVGNLLCALLMALLVVLQFVPFWNVEGEGISAMGYLGFSFIFDKCACCGNKLNENNIGFSYEYNGMLCTRCLNKLDNLELNKVEYAILRNISAVDIEKLSTLHFPSREDKVSVVTLLTKVFRLLTDEEVNTIKQFL